MEQINKVHEYIALIRKEAETDYWVTIPDIPGCYATGETADDAIIYFQQALESHIVCMRESDLRLPPARTLREVSEKEKEYIEAFVIEVAQRA